jgi:hypothetical protein
VYAALSEGVNKAQFDTVSAMIPARISAAWSGKTVCSSRS